MAVAAADERYEPPGHRRQNRCGGMQQPVSHDRGAKWLLKCVPWRTGTLNVGLSIVFPEEAGKRDVYRA